MKTQSDNNNMDKRLDRLEQMLGEVLQELRQRPSLASPGLPTLAQTADDDELVAMSAEIISPRFDKGKWGWYVKGGEWQTFGVRIFPEILAAAGIYNQLTEGEDFKLEPFGWVGYYTVSEDGHKKIVALMPPGQEKSTISPPSSSADSVELISSPARQVSALTAAELEHWTIECLEATDALFFDTAMVKLEPFFKTAANVTKFRLCLFGDWENCQARRLTAALAHYAAKRQSLGERDDSKELAKSAAYLAYGLANDAAVVATFLPVAGGPVSDVGMPTNGRK